MRFSFAQRALGLICICLLTKLCFPSSAAEPAILRPVRIAEPDIPSYLGSRDSNAYSKLDLQAQGQLWFGKSSENGSLFLANMTLYAPNGQLLVLLEQFDHLTSTVDCQGDDGEMSLTFKSPEVYQYALQAWGYINAKADDNFLLIANHQGCGPDEERQAYIITSIKEDSRSLTTFLTAEPARWSDIAGSYDLDFSHVVAHPHSLQRRDWLTGHFDETRTTDFDTTLGHRDKVDNIWQDDNRLVLDCVNCFVAGSIHLIGHIKTKHWELEVGTLSIAPKGFNATMALKATVTDNEKLENLSGKKELFSMPVPDLGFEIKHFCKVGLTLAYQVGFSTKFVGSATVSFGATSSLPDDAVVMVDLKDHEKSSFSGFEDAALLPLHDVTALSSSVKFAVFTQADIKFGIDFDKLEKMDVELNLKLPQLSTTFNAGYKEGGFCSSEKGATKTGAKVTTAVAIELWLEIYGQILKKRRNLFSHRFYNLTDILDEECMPFSIAKVLEAPSQGLSELLPVPTELISPTESDD